MFICWLLQTPNRNGRPPFDHFDSSRWLQVSMIAKIGFNTLDAHILCLSLFCNKVDFHLIITLVLQYIYDVSLLIFHLSLTFNIFTPICLTIFTSCSTNQWISSASLVAMQRYVEAQCCISSNDYKGQVMATHFFP